MRTTNLLRGLFTLALLSSTAVSADSEGGINAINCFGTGAAGAGGTIPTLSFAGTFTPGSDVTVTIENGPSSSLSYLLMGLDSTSIPLGNATLYVALGSLVSQTRTNLTGPSGSATDQVTLTLPPANPGTPYYFQAIMRSGLGSGVAASNACALTIQGVGALTDNTSTSSEQVSSRSKKLRLQALKRDLLN